MVARRSARLKGSPTHLESCPALETSSHASDNAPQQENKRPADMAVPDFQQQRLVCSFLSSHVIGQRNGAVGTKLTLRWTIRCSLPTTLLQAKIRANAARLAELASLADDFAVLKRPKPNTGSTKGVKKAHVQKKTAPVPPSQRRTRASGLDEHSQRCAAGLEVTRKGMCGR